MENIQFENAELILQNDILQANINVFADLEERIQNAQISNE